MVATPRARRRMTSRQAVLDALRAAYPGGMDTMQLIEAHGPSAQSRVGDLVEDGWDIQSDTSGSVAVYRLASLTRGEADPMTWGLRARVGPRTGLVVSEMSTGRVRLPPDRLARLLARVRAVVEDELAQAGVELGTVRSDDPYVLFGVGADPEPESEPDDIDLYGDDIDLDLDLDEEDDR